MYVMRINEVMSARPGNVLVESAYASGIVSTRLSAVPLSVMTRLFMVARRNAGCPSNWLYAAADHSHGHMKNGTPSLVKVSIGVNDVINTRQSGTEMMITTSSRKALTRN